MARVVVTNWVLEPQMRPRMIKALDKAQGIQPQRLTIKQRWEKLSEKLDLGGLESWPPELVSSAWSLLAEHHDIFFSGTQQAGLYSFNQTCDQSH